jgi:hypothetical protein
VGRGLLLPTIDHKQSYTKRYARQWTRRGIGEGKKPLGRPKHRGDILKKGMERRVWLNLCQGRDKWRRVVSTALKLQVA